MLNSFYLKRSFLDHDNHSSLEDAPDKPLTPFVSIIVIFCFLFVFGVWILASSLLWKSSDYANLVEKPGMGNQARMDYIKSETEYLSSSKKLDDGFYKIPIDQAILKVVNDESSIR